jgi:hypothetical protein
MAILLSWIVLLLWLQILYVTYLWKHNVDF